LLMPSQKILDCTDAEDRDSFAPQLLSKCGLTEGRSPSRPGSFKEVPNVNTALSAFGAFYLWTGDSHRLSKLCVI
jgi:hypothetical protein